MNLHRIVELQASTVTREITDDQSEYEFIEDLIESTKPEMNREDWHNLIATPFRYDVPVLPQYEARFKPAFTNARVFYGALETRTALFEFSYHWMQERIHLTGLSQTIEARTYFTVAFKDSHLLDLRTHADIRQIIDRKSYAASHAVYRANPNVSSILYPSSRLTEGMCVAAFQLTTLAKKPNMSTLLHARYDEGSQAAVIEDPSGVLNSETILWKDVA